MSQVRPGSRKSNSFSGHSPNHLSRCLGLLLPGLIYLAGAITSLPAAGAEFNVAAGDVAGLAAAIIQANSNADCANTIVLPSGTWKLNQAWTGADTFPRTGLPMVRAGCAAGKSTLEIKGSSTDATVIERAANAPKFRILAVIDNGTRDIEVKLSNLTLRCGDVSSSLTPWCDGVSSSGPMDASDGGAVLVSTVLNEDAFGRIALLLDRVAVTNNRARDGGALWFDVMGAGTGPSSGGTLTITSGRFEQNSAAGEGGAIRNNGARFFMDDSSVFANRAGNGIVSSDGTEFFDIRRTSISNNQLGGGAALAIVSNQASVDAVALLGNSGNGISFEFGEDLILSRSTISGNSGAGITSADSFSLTIRSSTFVQNGGGALRVFGGGPIVSSSILISPPGVPNCPDKDNTSQGFNLDSDGSCGFHETGDASFFDPTTVLDLTARNNGGPTFTHALVPGGLAVDRFPCGGRVDQRGALAQDGNGDGIPGCDVGAFELQPTTLLLTPTADTYIRTDLDLRRNDNYGRQQFIEIGTGRGGDNKPLRAADAMRSLVRFSLPSAPSLNLTGAVLEATLKGYDNGLPTSIYTIDAHAILPAAGRTPWAEGNGFEGTRPLGAPPTVTDPDHANGVAWAGSGDNSDVFAANNTTQPPFDPTILASQSIRQGQNQPGDVFLWDVLGAANKWVKGTLANNGIMLTDVTADTSFRGVRLGSREDKLFNLPNAVNGPVLKLSWTVGTKPGDFTGDNCVDNSDLAILLAVARRQAIAGTGLRLDLNADGRVDIADARKLITLFTNPGGAPCN